MIEEYKKKTNIGVGVGLVLQIVGFLMMGSYEVAILIVAVGGVLVIYGCFMYAAAKGYPMILGLIGIFGLIGLLILVAIPDKAKEGTPPPAAPAA